MYLDHVVHDQEDGIVAYLYKFTMSGVQNAGMNMHRTKRNMDLAVFRLWGYRENQITSPFCLLLSYPYIFDLNKDESE